jgi:hypothetical protein
VASGARCASAPIVAHHRDSMGSVTRPREASRAVTWGGGLWPETRKGGGGGHSASGMVLGARRLENGDRG